MSSGNSAVLDGASSVIPEQVDQKENPDHQGHKIPVGNQSETVFYEDIFEPGQLAFHPSYAD